MICTKCKIDQPPEMFWKDKRRPNGKRRCKTCLRDYQRLWRASHPDHEKQRYAIEKDKTRERHLLRKYGIDLAEYQALLCHQGGQCAICKRPESETKMFDVDHDHASGEVRGLLCSSCNRMLGYALDLPARLRAGARYLLAHKSLP